MAMSFSLRCRPMTLATQIARVHDEAGAGLEDHVDAELGAERLDGPISASTS